MPVSYIGAGLRPKREMRRFTPLKCISSSLNNCTSNVAVIILNKTYSEDSTDSFIKDLWHNATYRTCTDGGANFVYDIQQGKDGTQLQMPNLVCGDFDSIRPEVKEFYTQHGNVEVIATPDQDNTDFTKAIKILGEKMKHNLLDVDLVVAFSGRQNRCDHTMANISTLYRAQKLFPDTTRLCLVHDRSYITLLQEGKTIMDVTTGHEGDWCGLIPVGHPTIVSSTGLKWNIHNFKLEFGEMISTSNELDGSGIVTVEADRPIIWTMSFKV